MHFIKLIYHHADDIDSYSDMFKTDGTVSQVSVRSSAVWEACEIPHNQLRLLVSARHFH